MDMTGYEEVHIMLMEKWFNLQVFIVLISFWIVLWASTIVWITAVDRIMTKTDKPWSFRPIFISISDL
jgi:hypothetical protein